MRVVDAAKIGRQANRQLVGHAGKAVRMMLIRAARAADATRH